MVFWPIGTDTRGQPIAVGGCDFFSDSESLHALDKENGCHLELST